MIRPKTRQGNCYKSSLACSKARSRGRVFWVLKLIAGMGLLVGLSFVFIFAYDFLTQCDFFNAAEVTTVGNQRISAQEIRRTARIDEGTNILGINLGTARKRLLAHTWIATAKVRRELPDRICIEVREHIPLAVFDLGRKLYVNREGEIFKEVSPQENPRLPLVTGLAYSDINLPDQTPSRPLAAVMAILHLGCKPESMLPNNLLKGIHVDREIGITVYAFEGRRAIKLGYEDYDQKYNRLRNVLLHLNQAKQFSGFLSIDLKDMDRIVVNPIWIGPSGQKRKEA